ncbi:MAG: hypothetical protein K0B87_05615 [Candidatus Syntrophosphaera sp.]|nr:hypothetical protein [Candidatus Syntrophosphaera sp.]
MSLIALLLGAIAAFNPFVGLILMLVYSRFLLRNLQRPPLNRILLFFVFPILFALLLQQPGTNVLALDAVIGVGLAVLVFLRTLGRQEDPTAALVHSALLIIIYGMARHFLFGAYLIQANEQAVSEMGRLFPRFVESPDLQRSLDIMRYLLPAGWTVPQLAALFLGFVFFLHLGGSRFAWRAFSVPKYYNLLILAVLPLYFFPGLRMVFVNTLISLCVLPLIQGIGVVLHHVSRWSSNALVLVLVTVLIIFNLILVALLGFADIWLDLRKLNVKGIYT